MPGDTSLGPVQRRACKNPPRQVRCPPRFVGGALPPRRSTRRYLGPRPRWQSAGHPPRLGPHSARDGRKGAQIALQMRTRDACSPRISVHRRSGSQVRPSDGRRPAADRAVLEPGRWLQPPSAESRQSRDQIVTRMRHVPCARSLHIGNPFVGRAQDEFLVAARRDEDVADVQ